MTTQKRTLVEIEHDLRSAVHARDAAQIAADLAATRAAHRRILDNGAVARLMQERNEFTGRGSS